MVVAYQTAVMQDNNETRCSDVSPLLHTMNVALFTAITQKKLANAMEIFSLLPLNRIL